MKKLIGRLKTRDPMHHRKLAFRRLYNSLSYSRGSVRPLRGGIRIGREGIKASHHING